MRSLAAFALLLGSSTLRFSTEVGSSVGFATALKHVEDFDPYDDEDYEDDSFDDTMHEEFTQPNMRAQYEAWSNDEMTTRMWSIIDQGDVDELRKIISLDPDIVHLRSEDGRGPLFWAFEYDRTEMVDLLLENGADPRATDSSGNSPSSLAGRDGRTDEL